MPVRLSSAARRDLSEIWQYSATRWNTAQADRYLRLLTAGFDGLAAETLRGRSAEDVRPGYWRLALGSHVVFFRIGPSGAIEIVRVLHRSMDVERHL